MIIPIFIPRFIESDEEKGHGYGCKCPKCLEKEKWANKPREYFKYKYAIPKSFVYKNILVKTIKYICVFISLIVVFFPIFITDFFDFGFKTLLFVLLGLFLFACSLIVFEKFIKSEYECKDKIRIEIKDSFIKPENFKDKISKMSIPKGYIFTKEKSDWRYK